MRSKPTIELAITLLLVLLTSGCATHYGAAMIESEPSGAKIINLNDGSVIGVTPTVYLLKDSSDRRQTIIIRLKKDGYYDKTSSFWMDMQHATAENAERNAGTVKLEMLKKGGTSPGG